MNSTVAEALKYASFALAGWLTVVWVCGAVYVAVSYAQAFRYVPARPLARVLAAALRESWLVLWSQPLMPWFWAFGKNIGSGGGDVPVVLVHGYFQNRLDFLYLAARLRAAGCGPLFACNFFWPQSLVRSSADVLAFVAKVRARTGAPQIDILTHSSGGLFVLDMLADEPEIIRRAALIAVPARGVPWRGPVIGTSGAQLLKGSRYQAGRPTRASGVPVLSIYSVHDNMVHPVETSHLDGETVTNVEVQEMGHLSMLFDREVADTVCGFLLPESRASRSR
jgi:predicted alpha/beta hydrolase family esterase